MNLSSVSKAVAGAIVTVIVAYAARHGVTVDSSLGEALNVVLAFIVGFVGVYIAPKNTR